MNNKKSEEKTPLQRHLEDLFTQMIPNESTPTDIKEEVFKTIQTIELMSDFGELFTGQMIKTEATFIDVISSEEEE